MNTDYKQGWDAYMSGLYKEDCPHTNNLSQGGDWLDGWWGAQMQLRDSNVVAEKPTLKPVPCKCGKEAEFKATPHWYWIQANISLKSVDIC